MSKAGKFVGYGLAIGVSPLLFICSPELKEYTAVNPIYLSLGAYVLGNVIIGYDNIMSKISELEKKVDQNKVKDF